MVRSPQQWIREQLRQIVRDWIRYEVCIGGRFDVFVVSLAGDVLDIRNHVTFGREWTSDDWANPRYDRTNLGLIPESKTGIRIIEIAIISVVSNFKDMADDRHETGLAIQRDLNRDTQKQTIGSSGAAFQLA